VSGSRTAREREIARPVGTGTTNRGPMFHVKRGHPTPEELAALTAVLAAKALALAAAGSRRAAGPTPWGSPTAAHRQPLPAPGPGAWKRAGRGGDWAGGGEGSRVNWARGGTVGRVGGGLWTTEDPTSAAGLPSRIGGPGSRGPGSRVSGVVGTAGRAVAGPTVTAVSTATARPTLTAGGADA
jgi:acyl-CoA carboxylase epsilon subunit